MSLAGGSADKLGNRYELWWTVLKVMDILRGQWDAIRIEEPGIEKAEFILRGALVKSLHQAKRQAGDGKWTLAELASKDNPYLQTIGQQLQAPNTHIVFVSGSDAPELAELSTRARDSASPEEFNAFFVQSKKHQAGFSHLQRIWSNCSAETARDYLKRIEVRVIDEKSLRDQTLMTAKALFLLSPETVCSVIARLVLDSVHRELSRAEIIDFLAKAGYNLRQVANAEQARPLIDAVTQRYLDNGQRRLIQGKLVPRAVTEQLRARMNEPKTDCAVTGRAGTGKSGCVAEFVQCLKESGIPVLAFRLDRIDPVKSTKELGQGLGFEESPALLLGAASEGHEKAALVIDQLDSISTTSGRTTGFFDAVEALMNEVRGLQAKTEIHVFVVCREFDWKNDHRLRKLLNKEHAHITIGDFTKEQVNSILEESGVSPNALTPRQLDLLCLPQNLSLFLESSSTSVTSFNTTIDLFDRYWTTKRISVAERSALASDSWSDVIQAMVDGMTTSQQLSVRRETLDKCAPQYVDQMISEGVITRDGHRVGFGHESFFDYCFARQFVLESRTLVEFLLQGEQHLFRRAQVRQVLQYLHEGEADRFCAELIGLIDHKEIRTHLKDLALAVAASSATISPQEWELWIRLIAPHVEAMRTNQPDDLIATLTWKHFYFSSSLFEQALQVGLVHQWLESDSDAVVDMGLSFVRAHEARFSGNAAALLAPFAGRSEVWNKRLVWFMQLVNLKASREMFDLFLQLLADGTLDEARGPIAANSTFWNLAYDLAEKDPARVCEIVGAWLGRQLELAKASDTGEHLVSFRHDTFAEQPISKAAERTPSDFIKHVFPAILSIASWASLTEDELPKKDRVWRYLTIRDTVSSPEDIALHSLVTALRAVAQNNPEQLDGYVQTLRGTDLYVANILLLAIYSGNGAHFANIAAETLMQQPWRFESGLSGNSQWYAQQAIGAIFEHNDKEHQALLESTVLGYVSPREKESYGYKYHGSVRFNLLAAIPSHLLSNQGARACQELERKFGKPAGKPEGGRGGFVSSPIPDDGLAKMDDNAILLAIEHFSKNTRPHNFDSFLRGGSLELARSIGRLAEKEPSRFAKVALKIPSDADPVFLRELLRVYEKATLDDSIKLQIGLKAFAEHRDDCGKEIADVLGTIKDPLPQDAAEQLEWLAIQSPEPPFGQEDKADSREQDDLLKDSFNRGLNLTRGRAVLAIGHLIQRDSAYIPRFSSTLDQLTVDKSAAVQACSTYVWRVVAGGDYLYAYEMFQKCHVVMPFLPTTQYGFDLIQVGLRDHFSLLRPLIEDLFESKEGECIVVASQLACLAALTHPEAYEMADRAVNGNEKQRLVAAHVAAANLGSDEFRPWCEKQLYVLFNDLDSKVCSATGDCFRGLEGQSLEEFSELIEAYCRSAAYEANSYSLLHTLEESVEKLPGIVCMACEHFLMRFGKEASDIRTSRAADGYGIPKLAFRVYHQHQRDEWASRALDVIDRLCEVSVGETSAQLQEYDR
jgi:hypothetical protein